MNHTKHTAGALKAAKIIMNGKARIKTEYGEKSIEGIADLIERETAAPEMYEALKELDEAAYYLETAGRDCAGKQYWDALTAARVKACAALRAAGGE